MENDNHTSPPVYQSDEEEEEAMRKFHEKRMQINEQTKSADILNGSRNGLIHIENIDNDEYLSNRSARFNNLQSNSGSRLREDFERG